MKLSLKTMIFAVATALTIPVFADQNGTMDDSAITQSVQSRISADRTLSNAHVDVSTNNGMVVLSGQLNTDNEASRAIEIAEDTPGVKDVDTTNLNVKKSRQPLTDTYITAKVKGTLMREKIMGDKQGMSPMTIHVETKNSVVYLTGTADSQQQAAKAIQLAQSINGVKRVSSKVRVTNTNKGSDLDNSSSDQDRL